MTMDHRNGFRLLLPLLMLVAGAGCSSSSSAQPTSATTGKKRYIYLPPETGSLIPRRIEITRDGTTNAAPSSVRNYGAGAIDNAGRGSSAPLGGGK